MRRLLPCVALLFARPASPAQQQLVLIRTLRVLMTPVLPPFYRIFMGGVVPSIERGDPQWLVDAVQSVVRKLPAGMAERLAPGTQLEAAQKPAEGLGQLRMLQALKLSALWLLGSLSCGVPLMAKKQQPQARQRAGSIAALHG